MMTSRCKVLSLCFIGVRSIGDSFTPIIQNQVSCNLVSGGTSLTGSSVRDRTILSNQPMVIGNMMDNSEKELKEINTDVVLLREVDSYLIERLEQIIKRK